MLVKSSEAMIMGRGWHFILYVNLEADFRSA